MGHNIAIMSDPFPHSHFLHLRSPALVSNGSWSTAGCLLARCLHWDFFFLLAVFFSLTSEYSQSKCTRSNVGEFKGKQDFVVKLRKAKWWKRFLVILHSSKRWYSVKSCVIKPSNIKASLFVRSIFSSLSHTFSEVTYGIKTISLTLATARLLFIHRIFYFLSYLSFLI